MTILGITGNTWGKTGPTPVGWTVFGLALALLLVTLGKHYIDRRETGKIAEVARLQACRGAWSMTAPFAILLVDATRREYREGRISQEAADDMTLALSEFIGISNEDHLPLALTRNVESLRTLSNHETYLQDTALNDTAPLKQPTSDHTPASERMRTSWRNIFESYTGKGIGYLDAALSSYRSVLSSKEVIVIQDLRNSWLTQRLENLSQVPESIRLVDFLRLHKRAKVEQGVSIYEEFLRQAHDVGELCAAQAQETGENSEVVSDPVRKAAPT